MATLQLAIDARRLLATAKQVEHGLGGIKTSAQKTFHTVKSAADIALGPLKLMITTTVALKASMIALGAASVGAAGQYEMFRQQLLRVIRDKEKADQAFRESIEFSVKTPFTPAQIVETRLALESVGITGSEALLRVAEAAATMNRDILDVARAVKSMEVEPIRNLGIMMDELYRRGLSEKFRETAEGFREAQQMLLEMFGERFGGGLGAMSVTWQGLVSTLKGAVTDLRAEFGAGFLDQSKLFVNDLIRGAVELKKYAGEAGRDFGAEMMIARTYLLAGFETALKVAGLIREALKQEGGLGDVILEAFRLSTRILGQGIIAAFEVSIPLWRTIGTVLGAGVLDAIMRSGVPGAETLRGIMIEKKLGGMNESELRRLSIEKGLGIEFRTPDITKGGGIITPVASRAKTAAELASDMTKEILKLPIDLQIAFAQTDLDQVIEDNLTKAGGDIERITKGLGLNLRKDLQDFVDEIAKISGTEPFDISEDFWKNFDKHMKEDPKQLEVWRKELDTINKAIGKGAVGFDGATELQEITKVTTMDIAQAYARMYDQIDARSKESFDAKRRLLNEESKVYLETTKDEEAVRVYLAEMNRRLNDEQARASQDFFGGMQAGFRELERTQMTLGEIGYQTTQNMTTGMTTAFNRMTLEGATWRDAMKNYFTDVGMAFLRLMNQMAAESLMKDIAKPAFNWLGTLLPGLLGLGGGGGAGTTFENPQAVYGAPAGIYHGGGIAGVTNFSTRWVSPDIFIGAERRHGGLRLNEIPAILDRKEYISTPPQMNALVGAAARDKNAGSTQVHIHNESGVPLEITSSDQYMFGDDRIIDVVVQAAETNEKLRRAVKNVR